MLGWFFLKYEEGGLGEVQIDPPSPPPEKSILKKPSLNRIKNNTMYLYDCICSLTIYVHLTLCFLEEEEHDHLPSCISWLIRDTMIVNCFCRMNKNRVNFYFSQSLLETLSFQQVFPKSQFRSCGMLLCGSDNHCIMRAIKIIKKKTFLLLMK